MMRLMVSVASSVCSVEKHEVTGLGGEQRRFDRLVVAHLADEDDVGILPQRAAQRVRERRACRPTTSRWLTIDWWSRCRYSIGSSTVMMCAERVALM